MIKRKTKTVWYILGIITFFLLFALVISSTVSSAFAAEAGDVAGAVEKTLGSTKDQI